MTRDDIHTCSYSCERPACIKAQRDELTQRLSKLQSENERLLEELRQGSIDYTRAEVERLREALAAEREACAKLCDELRDEDGFEPYGTECAAAIRARVT